MLGWAGELAVRSGLGSGFIQSLSWDLMALEPETMSQPPRGEQQVRQHVSLILGPEDELPEDSSLALGPEDREALLQPVPGDPLPRPADRHQEVRTEGCPFVLLASGLELFLEDFCCHPGT